jgi:hypothetical protein
MRLRVNVFGCINDQKFRMRGTGSCDPEAGSATLDLAYSNTPQHWHIFNYSDPLILLTAYKEIDGGLNFLSMAHQGYEAECTIDFGAGLMLRKTASVWWEADTVHADYCLWGCARCQDISSILPYDEHMIPVGDGKVIAIGLARWGTTAGPLVEAVVSSRYTFVQPKAALAVPQKRHFDVTARVSPDGLTFHGEYVMTMSSL